MKYKLLRNDLVLWNHTFSNHIAQGFFRDILLLMKMHICGACVYWKTSQWCESIQHCTIDVPFFSLFGCCQRSTSNSMRWNQALRTMSHWCITRPRRSHLCKHTLSKPIEDVGCWPSNSLWCIFRGKGSCDSREHLCSYNDFLVANEEGQAIKTGRARVSTIILCCLKWSMS